MQAFRALASLHQSDGRPQLRANVSMDALVSRHLAAVQEANDAERDTRASGKFRKLCGTDPDARCHCCAIDEVDGSRFRHCNVARWVL